MAKASKSKTLPSAPLIEAVFELHWALPASPGVPDPLRMDPALIPLLERFSAGMKKIGFATSKDMAAADSFAAAYSVSKRFFRKPELPFPIMQIGPGIFASNESTLYEWRAFKAQIIRGVEVLINAYPKIPGFQLTPNYLELRYIDAFDKTLLGHTSLFPFLEQGTAIRVATPKMLNNPSVFSGEADGRLIWQRNLKGKKESKFILDIGSGRKGDKTDIVRMESKVVTRGLGVPKLKSSAKFKSDISKWLEFAHGVTSPFFQDFITPNVMAKFAKK